MKSLLRDDKGIAFGIVTVIFFILIAGAIYLFLTIAFNGFFGTANTMIDGGSISQKAKDSLSFVKTLFAALPLIIIIGALFWAWVRATENRNSEG